MCYDDNEKREKEIQWKEDNNQIRKALERFYRM